MRTLVLIAAMLAAQGPAPVVPGQVPGQVQGGGATQPAGASEEVPSAVVRGMILRADGRPLPRAQVRLTSQDRPGGARIAIADNDGRFELVGLLSGSYTLAASKAGYIGLEFGQRRAFERGQPIRLNRGEVRERADIVLPRGGAIAGRVIDENGDGVEGALVRALQIRFEAGRRRLVEVPGVPSRRTDDRGAYRLYNLQPGQYVVSVVVGQVLLTQQTIDLPGYALTYFPGTANPTEAQLLSIGLSEELAAIDIPLSRAPTARITGISFDASGEPSLGGLVLNNSQRTSAVSAIPVGARINPDGTFEFPNVAPGEYVIHAFRGKSGTSIEGPFAAQYVTVGGEDVAGVVLRMSRGSAISGRITFEGGMPPRPGDLELMPVPVDFDVSPVMSNVARADIHADWTFDIGGISGIRRLRLTRAPAAWALKAILVGGQDVTDAALGFGSPAESRADVEVIMTNRVTAISGTVSDDRGRPLNQYAVVAFAAESERREPRSRFLRRATPGRDGTFTVRGLAPGQYFVAAIDEVQGTDEDGDWQDPDFLESLVLRAARVTVSEGQRVALDLKLNPR